LQQHPEKTDLRDQLISYVLGQSDMTVEDLQELLNNIFSPVLKQEIMINGNGFIAVAAREAAAKAKAEAQLEASKAANIAKLEIDKARRETSQVKTLTVIHGWHGGVSLSLLTSMTGLRLNKVTELVTTFEKVKATYSVKTDMNISELKQLSGLTEAESKVLLTLLQKHI
jgi:hypothetical protein